MHQRTDGVALTMSVSVGSTPNRLLGRDPIGVKADFIDTQWSGVIPALYVGRFDMVPTLSYTKERMERVLFSIPYADASQALLIRAADKEKIKTIADMSGKILGIKLGSPGSRPDSHEFSGRADPLPQEMANGPERTRGCSIWPC
jgi:ABC-type amino acid transport substrate-binding protein